MTSIKRLRALATIIVILVLLAPVSSNATESESGTYDDQNPETSPVNAREILWLARAVQSETNRKEEMLLVAWTVRNRVAAGHRGATYEEVVLAPGQFSGLNSADPRYEINISLDYKSDHPVWLDAVEIAEAVYFAKSDQNPLSEETRHFYSPHVVSKPDWARDLSPIFVVRDIDSGASRFAFYEGVR